MNWPDDFLGKVAVGDCLSLLGKMPDGCVNTCITSPPYWGLRDYGEDGQLGLEKTPDEYVEKMVGVFREVWRVLRPDGTLWLNIGDSYASDPAKGGSGTPNGRNNRGEKYARPGLGGLKPKDLVGIPWRVAFALQADGWYLRSDIIWSKPNPMPESVTDRPTKAHEYIFLMAKSQTYYYDADAIREPHAHPHMTHTGRHSDDGLRQGSAKVSRAGNHPDGRNKRSVWEVTTKPYSEAHFATFSPDLIKPCVLAGCPKGGVVLDCFMGAGTTGLVAETYDRRFVGLELNPEYAKMARERIESEQAQGKLF